MIYQGLSALIKNNYSPRIRQTYVALGPTLVTVSLGMAEGYSSILLPQLENENVFPIDSDMESWIASITALAMPLGCIFGGYFMEIIGRKGIHMVTCILNIIGWLAVYFSQSYIIMLIGRFITGLCVGLLGPPSGVYIAETSEPKFRGILIALLSVAITLGIGLTHVLGTFISWRDVALISCIFPLISFSAMLLAPESPTFLARKNKNSLAIEAFYWCRGQHTSAEAELKILLERQDVLSCKKVGISQYCKPEFIKPLILMVVFFITLQWSGHNAVTFYNVTILKSTLNDKIDEYFAMILMDLLRLICSIATCYLLKIMGRKTLGLIGCTGAFFSLMLISCSIYLLRTQPDLIRNGYLIVFAGFLGHMCFISLGVAPVPWTMTGEIFPLASRGMGSGIAVLINYGLIFTVVKSFPWIFENFGSDGTFCLYAFVCAIGAIILAIFLPETKDKPLHEIEDRFKSKNFEKN